MKNLVLILLLVSSFNIFAQGEGRISPNQLQKLDGRWMTNDVSKLHILTAVGTTDPKFSKFDSLLTAFNVITTTTTLAGDVTGTTGANTVIRIRNTPVATTTPTSGQVLKFDGTNWGPGTDNNNVYTAGAGIAIASNIVTNTGDTNAADDVLTSTSANGDVTGVFSTLSVVALRGRPLSSTAPSTGQVLRWDGSNWTPYTIPAAESLSYIGTVDVTTTTTAATMAGITAVDSKIIVLRNGQWTKGGAGRSWTKSSNTFTFTTTLVPGDVLDFYAIQ